MSKQTCGTHHSPIRAAYKKSQSHKQHIWFFAVTQANPEKPKELFFSQRSGRNDRRNSIFENE